jgi:rhomboid family protein
MGIYDRDYQRGYYGQAPGFHLGGSLTLTSKIAIVMFGVYVVQMLTRGQFPNDGWFTDLFSLHANFVKQPWRFFELLSYGFLHDVWDLKHIIFNMIAFWFFGRSVEYRYGRQEFLAFFLTAIVASGLAWTLGEYIANRQLTPVQILGASGGISAVLIVFCFNFPHQMVYIYGVLPIPAWVFAILFVGMDIFGASGRPVGGQANVAYTAHLGGAVFGFLYYQWGGRLERLLPSGAMWKRLRPKPKLRVIDPDSPESSDDSTDEQVDAILQKIQEHGRDSLTRRERGILEEASREYQKRRH